MRLLKTRSDLYSREAAELLRLITMYPGILELQLIRFFPGKETKIKNLLSHLKNRDVSFLEKMEAILLPMSALISVMAIWKRQFGFFWTLQTKQSSTL